jgi:hypothetical protein
MTEDIDWPDLETLGRLAPRQLSIANVPCTRLIDPKITTGRRFSPSADESIFFEVGLNDV